MVLGLLPFRDAIIITNWKLKFLSPSHCKGKQAYVLKLIYPDVEIDDSDIKIVDETLFSDYSKDVIRDIKKTMKDFWLGTV